jgi:hypothetical protein
MPPGAAPLSMTIVLQASGPTLRSRDGCTTIVIFMGALIKLTSYFKGCPICNNCASGAFLSTISS